MPSVSTPFVGDSGPSRRVRVVDQAFGRLRPVPEGPRFRPASRETLDGSRCRGAEQLSQGTRACTEGTWGRPAVRATPVRVGGPTLSNSSPGGLSLGSEGPQSLPDIFGDSGPVPRARWVDQVSRATRARAEAPRVKQMSPATPARLRVPVGSTSPPGRHVLGSEGPPV